MAKVADYLISGVWFSHIPHKHISDALLHKDNDTTVENGVKKTRQEIVTLIKAGKTIYTMKWNYASANWSRGAKVEIMTVGNTDYLRTHKDATTADNLDNMLHMSSLGQ